MVSAISVVTELFGAGALGFGAYYFFIRDQPSAEPTEKEGATDDAPAAPATRAVAVEKEPPATEQPQGIIGLSAPTAKKEVSKPRTPTANTPPPITPPPFDTIGVNINDYLDSSDASPSSDRQRRLEEELSFATEALSDLSDCDAAIVVDQAGDAVWATGELVDYNGTMGTLLSRVRETRQSENLNVENNTSVPFLKPEVRNVAAMSIGETGAVLVVASRCENFFGVVEKRVANAVCSRLAHFLPTPPSAGT